MRNLLLRLRRRIAALVAISLGVLSPAFAQQRFQRVYKATAYVTVFSVPVFSRSEVGYGLAKEERLPTGAGETLTLEFLGGSNPEHAHGLHRFGYIREIVQHEQDNLQRAHYTGLITANREDSLNDARAALNAGTAAKMPCLVALGEIADGQARSVVWGVLVAAPREPEVSDVMQVLRASLQAEPNSARTDRVLPASNAGTFLYTLRNAIRSNDTVTNHRFVYNAKPYTLRTEKHYDPAVEAQLRRSGLTLIRSRVIRLNATIENEATHDRTEFSLWYEDASETVLPLRFSFRPKSYLKLVFDAQPNEPATPHNEASPVVSSFSFR